MPDAVDKPEPKAKAPDQSPPVSDSPTGQDTRQTRTTASAGAPASPPTAELQRPVTVIRHADRHETLHRRAFAETVETTVPVGPLATVVGHALNALGIDQADEGKFTIQVGWPHE